MHSERTIQAGPRSLVIRFGQNSMFLIETHLLKMKEEGTLRPRVYTHTNKETGASVTLELPISVEDLTQLPPRLGSQVGLWAGLESARRYYKTRPEPFTLDETADIIDEAGGFAMIQGTVSEAFMAAFPEYQPKPEEPKAEDAVPNATSEPQPPTGTRSSSRPRKSA